MIKNTILAVLLGIFSFTVSAQKMAQITGDVQGLKEPRPVKLFKVVDGRSQEIATAIPQADFTFGFNFLPEYEGLYVVGIGNEGSPNNNFKFYLKPGDKLDLTLHYSPEITYKLKGKANSKENKLLTEWHELMFPLEDKAINFMGKNSTYVDYFPEQEEIMKKAQVFLNGRTTGNDKFDRMIKDIVALDMAMYATNFLNTPRAAHPSIEEYSPFYSTLKTRDYTGHTSQIYSHPWGLRTLDGLIRLNERQDGVTAKRDVEGLKTDFGYIANDTLKGDMLLETLERVKAIDGYENLLFPYEQYILTDNQKIRNQKLMLPLMDYKPGSRAYQFAYPDVNGKTVTMESLKGKVILVDVWATWCGPCLAELPALKKLEEEFEGTDVQVVSISVDEDKDKEKWKKMIAEKQMGGIQLFASGWSEITKYYKINGIPRFMVFDKQGRIVTTEAPRPSDPALKTLLQAELKK